MLTLPFYLNLTIRLEGYLLGDNLANNLAREPSLDLPHKLPKT